MPNLRGRKDPKDHRREQEKSGSDRETESDEQFNFGSAKEAKCGSAEESKSEYEGSSRRLLKTEAVSAEVLTTIL